MRRVSQTRLADGFHRRVRRVADPRAAVRETELRVHQRARFHSEIVLTGLLSHSPPTPKPRRGEEEKKVTHPDGK